ncbi:hypothetical protein CSUI_007735 [Cystoisospora suis]|uniref:Transmembrane protein n=1 Tax=Cystoisospora suis TaxID=483139 RepID=A0A2C6KPP0_9APIC|nr:hypothetical protein CSUI_007735 [Cystoisospora suis]
MQEHRCYEIELQHRWCNVKFPTSTLLNLLFVWRDIFRLQSFVSFNFFLALEVFHRSFLFFFRFVPKRDRPNRMSYQALYR